MEIELERKRVEGNGWVKAALFYPDRHSHSDPDLIMQKSTTSIRPPQTLTDQEERRINW
jgi:hypothetical protein